MRLGILLRNPGVTEHAQQCVPGSFTLPTQEPGNEASGTMEITILYHHRLATDVKCILLLR